VGVCVQQLSNVKRKKLNLPGRKLVVAIPVYVASGLRVVLVVSAFIVLAKFV